MWLGEARSSFLEKRAELSSLRQLQVFGEMRDMNTPTIDGWPLYALRSWSPIHNQEIPSWGSWGGSVLWETPKFPDWEGSYCIKLSLRALLDSEAKEQHCKETATLEGGKDHLLFWPHHQLPGLKAGRGWSCWDKQPGRLTVIVQVKTGPGVRFPIRFHELLQ